MWSKRIVTIFVMIICLLQVTVIPVSAANYNGQNIKEVKDIQIVVDGEKLSLDGVYPILQNKRTLIPLRTVFESMGAVVDWNEEEKSVFAVRAGQAIQLKINETEAMVGDEVISLDVPATLYNGRTYIPLRFVGEAYGGIVDWNDQSRLITISLPEDQVHELIDSTFMLNDKPLDSEIIPIYKNGRNYVSVEAILDGLHNDIYWTREGNQINVQLDGATMTLFVGETYAFVNGERIQTTEFPIEYKGEVLAPVRFIVEAFGGIAHYIIENKTTYIYINRPKFKTSFLTEEDRQIVTPIDVPGVSLVGNRRLMVSDNPEILDKQTITENSTVLWHDEVKSDESSVEHRVFGWHINNLDDKVKIGITIENLSQTNNIEIKGLEGVNRSSSNGWANYDVGLPIAETVLTDKLTQVKLDKTIVNQGEIVVMQEFTVNKDYLLGFLDDFTVERNSGDGPLHYKVRTVITQDNTSLSEIIGKPTKLDLERPHPRGTWQGVELEAKLPTYQVDNEPVAYSFSNGQTDNVYSETTSFMKEDGVIKNTGHYGAVYKVIIPITNPTGEEKTVRISMGGRGGLYNGAVKTSEGVFISPILEPMVDTVKVIDYEINGTEDVIELEVMHAGGAALAMALEISTVE
ncbi:stalk domain-containing protein [Bacillus solimangrovi]|uniref:Copper amine oxidase-like N-terminal domain-containing protein n=1 Tax=Bacillus solimangrovi TaxID=1305675 RepID=A0A1E5LEI8_9BACI|nr:stalk domain-containing protein [Bacillus solimangrovi]OEH92498.1 hypothetical protein BFG57_15695 [Bacillus solimangrovi]